MPQTLTNRSDAEDYVLEKVRSMCASERHIDLDKTFTELEATPYSDFYGAHLFLDIEEDFDIELTDNEVVAMNAGKLVDVVDFLVAKFNL